MKAPYSAKIVASLLETHLGRPLHCEEGDQVANTDICVDVTSQVHVQVGDTYLMVGLLTKDNKIIFWPQRQSWATMLQDLNNALQRAAQS